MENKQELKSCPFCGSKAEIYVRIGAKGVTCSNPDCHVSPYITPQKDEVKAIDLWNARSITPLVIDREKLAKIGFDFLGTMERGYRLADAIISAQSTILKQPDGVSVKELQEIIKYQKYKGDGGLAKAIKARLETGK